MPRSTIQAHFRKTHGDDLLTTADAAQAVGRSAATLRRYRLQGLIVPSEEVQMGKVKVHLYAPSDIEALHALVRQQRPGPKKKPRVTTQFNTETIEAQLRRRGRRR